MYNSTTLSTEGALNAWRVADDPESIWFGVRGIGTHSVHSVSFAECQRLITELQREMAAVEALARSAAA